ncbi:MAG: prepilin peptidase, partial [Firmicutes bacterium]|nr:prepilin peptidase [Bacillota bacterium]
GINLTIFILGVVQVIISAVNGDGWLTHIIGMVSVGGLFFLLWFATGGAGLGFGDVKLMAAAGLLLGFPRILLALIIGSVSGAILHSIRMKRGAGKKLAFGPYLSLGIGTAALFGEQIITAYLSLFGL